MVASLTIKKKKNWKDVICCSILTFSYVLFCIFYQIKFLSFIFKKNKKLKKKASQMLKP